MQKLGCHTLEDVVAAAQRIEKVLEEQSDSKMERLITVMQDQIRLLKKDLKDARDQISASATPTAALAASPTATVAAAYLPPLAQPPLMAAAQPPPLAAAQPPPLATAQPPPYPLARHIYQDYADEGPILECHAASRTEGLLDASYEGKRVILCPTAPLAPSFSAYCASSSRNSSRLAKRASPGATSSR